ncbi:MAG: glutamate--tRNA ligase [bacterium]|nr:glutamate--tRNA ligase [bacterium]
MTTKYSQQNSIRVRMAPSPTGRLHIGTARTALFNYLYAKKTGGAFVLRIEDTDVARSNPEFEKDILENLKWLGIAWDEGPDVGGPYAPYRQSERTASYRQYLEKLLEEQAAYWCFCTPEALEIERQTMQAEGKAPRYAGTCRQIKPEDAEKRRDAGERGVIRFKMPQNTATRIDDLIRGPIVFGSENFDDFVIAKSLDEPLYNFAVVIDDYDMQITHVIRGEDHITNTPKQYALIDALGFPHVAYAHLPLILGPDRSKMSKRHGSVALGEYREQGYLPEALLNFLAFLGWNPGTDEEILSNDQIIERFSIESIQKSGAIFDQQKLDWMNGMYIRQQGGSKRGPLLELIKPYIERAGFADAFNKYNFNDQSSILALVIERMKKISEFVELSEFFFKTPEYDRELLRWKNMTDEEIAKSLSETQKLLGAISDGNFTTERIDAALKTYAEHLKDKGSVFWPLRVALTGRKASPPPAAIAAVFGKLETLKRIQIAIDKLAS